jgi:peroxiredoxin Q/BCP
MDVGDTVEDFESIDQRGEPVRLSDQLAKGPVVLFFYPKAMTAGCTAEACHFRDLSAEFARVGATPIGISGDSVDAQAEFDRRNSLGVTLLSDADSHISKMFGVKRPGPLGLRRTTFVIDPDSTIKKVISSEFNMDTHADEALAVLSSSVSD